MTWNYAELSKAAKEAGGPEALLAIIEKHAKAVGRVEGQKSMIPVIGAGVVASAGITILILKIADYLKKKEAISQKEVEDAKAEIIEGIKDYDAAHPNDANPD